MNRETSIHSSDTLVVVDRSRRRRQIIVAAAVVVILLLVGVGLLMARGSNKPAQGTAGAASQAFHCSLRSFRCAGSVSGAQA